MFLLRPPVLVLLVVAVLLLVMAVLLLAELLLLVEVLVLLVLVTPLPPGWFLVDRSRLGFTEVLPASLRSSLLRISDLKDKSSARRQVSVPG